MKKRTFLILLTIMLSVCIALTAAHIIYAYRAYEQCSIIYFIGKELW